MRAHVLSVVKSSTLLELCFICGLGAVYFLALLCHCARSLHGTGPSPLSPTTTSTTGTGTAAASTITATATSADFLKLIIELTLRVSKFRLHDSCNPNPMARLDEQVQRRGSNASRMEPPRFRSEREVSKFWKHTVIIYSIPDSEQCYVFPYHKKTSRSEIHSYRCRGCKNITKHTAILQRRGFR
ncbi:hypothetical protein Y032_0566g18 [Ancylostoma ceylanicum]|uniref:Uncharacterized protein n=1 Tax=Ancylostoma ceylanicum TaxID=53326 RepID=A0A016WR72_9BILA|nr:hypothetical protein Y032_0566g18 [Ancylostoma ceylanicum]